MHESHNVTYLLLFLFLSLFVQFQFGIISKHFRLTFLLSVWHYTAYADIKYLVT